MRCRLGWPFLTALGLGLSAVWPAAGQEPYRKPPQEIMEILEAQPLPDVSVSPDRAWLLFADRASMPSIGELAAPMLRLAGYRINPATNGMSGVARTTGLRLKRIDTGAEHRIDVPAAGAVGGPAWSPDNTQIAFTLTLEDRIELWVADIASGRTRQVSAAPLNPLAGGCDWLPDSRRLLCPWIPEGRGPVPARPGVPTGPIVQETSGNTAAVPTYQDLLRNPYDEALFDHYFTAQLAVVDVASGRRTPVGEPAIFAEVSLAPGGEYVLVTRVKKPYSYSFPASAFPRVQQVWDLSGRAVHTVAERPLQDNLPVGRVITGPRYPGWRQGVPASLYWIEALDGGDERTDVPHHDRVMLLSAPFTGEPIEIARTGKRFGGMVWSSGRQALISDMERATRRRRTWVFEPDRPERPWRLLWDRSVEDAYGDPGTPLLEQTAAGSVLFRHGDWIYLTGQGASPQGDRPFIDRLNLRSLNTERLWRSDTAAYEYVVSLLDSDARRVITRRESPTVPPNYFIRELRSGRLSALTDFADPAPQLTGISKQLVTYTRADGVPLNGTLYLPPGYRQGTRLPVVVWAYPREFTSAGTAGQVRGTTNRFTRIGGWSHLFFLTQGYAVFDGPSMPIVGGDTANDSYITQLVANAEAAVGKLVEMGVADPDRIGVGGHSYGAFMTANLLAHTDLFRAGIALSGAYNRTLTPFGFQSERRSFWEATDAYQRMSPFWYADRLKEPILFIHGEADSNTGTFPMQSERMYAALKGNGGTARLVLLPAESHSYLAAESVEHVLYEMISWFDRYVKNAPPRTRVSDDQGE